jgi:TM2 domain-containing membrane protein YozV
VLQIVLPFGVGRFYAGQAGVGVAQLLLSFFGIGILGAWIDGILILAGRPVDQYGRPLRP